ncbi:MAG: polysaccharide pyruvyl transferase family protein [Oscillospiraceae bacterium]|nr:polysaccharide pyruvyl transferase family protein [Oscillospiraceae bacterium]
MKKILLYGHGGAYNHGAEAIVRTSVPVFRQAGGPVLLSTHFPEQDREFGLDKLVDKLIPASLSLVPEERAAEGFAAKERIAAKIYREALAEIDRDTICVGIGGDNYCYPNWHRQSIFHRTAKERGGKSILWGCSIEPEQINGEMKRVLSEHDHIYAREGLTAAALRKHGITQVTQAKDPAFSLLPEPVPLPENFGEHTAALNLSPMVLRRSKQLLYHFAECAHWLSARADALLMIPHVTTPADDDKQALEELEQLLTPSERSRICWAPAHLNAAQRKYLISKCAILVCCRTHASIAAYSAGVPVIVVGYSVKSQGIGLDVGMERWVVPVENSADLVPLTAELWNRAH